MVYPITKLWFYPFNWIMVRRIKGMENIPKNKPFIVVSNHEKLVDPLYITYPIIKKLNKKIHFLSSASWWFLGETICRKWAGCIPLFDKEQAYKETKGLIESGEIVAIFPEGGTRRTKNPKTGAVRLAIETKTSILPVGLKSSYIPFSSALNIGRLIHPKKNKNIEKQTINIMGEVYKLRDGV